MTTSFKTGKACIQVLHQSLPHLSVFIIKKDIDKFGYSQNAHCLGCYHGNCLINYVLMTYID